MKTILCYGDSNTWGSNPADGSRFPADVRWTGVLQQRLGNSWKVIEEGLCGRTTVFDDPMMEGRNGKIYLGPCLDSHAPVDMVVLKLGTNDLKMRFSAPAEDIARGVEILGSIIRSSDAGPGGNPPKLLIVVPAPIIEVGQYAAAFAGGAAKSAVFSRCYRDVADLLGCLFLDAGAIISSSPVDGIHLEADAHCLLGEALAALL